MPTTSLLCVLAAFAIRSVASSVNRPCTNLNPHIEVLRAKKVAIYENSTSETAPSPCQEEWSKFGTCCGLASVKEYVLREREEIQALIRIYSTSMFNVSEILYKLESFAYQIYYTGYYPFGRFYNDYVMAFLVDRNGKYKPLFDVIRNTQAFLFSPKSPYIAKTGNCMQLLMNVRTNSLCSVCSGRSNETFFDNSTKKARLGTPHCKVILDECVIPFVYITNYTMSAFNVGFQSYSSGYELFMSDPSMQALLLAYRQLAVDMHGLSLYNNLITYFSTQDPSTKLAVQKSLCDSLIRLSKDLFLKTWINQQEQLLKVMNYAYDRVEHINKMWKVMNPNFPKRVLQQQQSVSFLPDFEGDVITTDYVSTSEDNTIDKNSTVITMALTNSSMW
jgi:hypothetical protein